MRYQVTLMIRQGELTSAIARLILAAIDGEWTSVVYEHRMLTALSQSHMTIERASGPIDAASYADDLEDFRRADEFIPMWLRGRLHEAGA